MSIQSLLGMVKSERASNSARDGRVFYSQTFRDTVASEYKSGRFTAKHIGDVLNISPSLIYKWTDAKYPKDTKVATSNAGTDLFALSTVLSRLSSTDVEKVVTLAAALRALGQ